MELTFRQLNCLSVVLVCDVIHKLEKAQYNQAKKEAYYIFGGSAEYTSNEIKSSYDRDST